MFSRVGFTSRFKEKSIKCITYTKQFSEIYEVFWLSILFQSFVKKHGKKYVDKNEYKRRYKVFRQNMKKVQFLRETEKGTGEYGVTEFSDLTEEEYRKNKLGLKQVKNGPLS